MGFKEIAAKKVFGIPILYLALAAAIVLAYFAFKMKPAATPEEETPTDPTTEDGIDTDGDGIYDSYETTGTVVVQPQAAPTTSTTETNETWERNAIKYLIEQKAGTPGAIQEAINTYLNGGDLTYEQGLLRDKALVKLGPPPESFTLGTTGAKKVTPATIAPAQRQFTNFPGSHTVKGSNDNTPTKLAILYWGNGNYDRIDKIVAANPKLGPAGTTYPVGTKIWIPAWITPKFVIATTSMRDEKTLAAKNGISKETLMALNPNRTYPVPVGTKIRVN